MSGTTVIRAAVAADAPAIAEMMGEFFAYLCSLDRTTSTYSAADGEARIARAGFGEWPRFSGLVAETGGRPEGYALYNVIWWPDTLQTTLFLTDLFVREAARRSGLGKAMMERLEQIGREQGCEQLMWTVWRLNPAAGAFYERLGAEEMPGEYVMRLEL
jgi:GNAT superfamily N-acetyltransferase